MRGLTKAQLALYQEGVAGLRRKPSENDNRVGSTHERMNRSFIRVQYGPHTVVFYPLKEWVAVVGVSNPTLRSWLKARVITAYIMHRMPVMCKAEIHALRKAIDECGFHRKQLTFDDTFSPTAMRLLTEVRTALDKVKRNMPLTENERLLILPSLTTH